MCQLKAQLFSQTLVRATAQFDLGAVEYVVGENISKAGNSVRSACFPFKQFVKIF